MGIFSHLMSMQEDKANTPFVTKLGMGVISGGIGSFVGASDFVACSGSRRAQSSKKVSARKNAMV